MTLDASNMMLLEMRRHGDRIKLLGVHNLRQRHSGGRRGVQGGRPGLARGLGVGKSVLRRYSQMLVLGKGGVLQRVHEIFLFNGRRVRFARIPRIE